MHPKTRVWQGFAFLSAAALITTACGASGAEDTDPVTATGNETQDAPDETGDDSTAGAESGEPEQTTARQVSLRLDWLLGAQHSAYFVADELGYYDEAGLEVEILEGEGSSTTATLVGTGEDDFGVVAAGSVVSAVGAGVPIRAVATLYQSTPTSIIYLEDDPLTDITDLEGRDLGVIHSSVTYNEWEAVAEANSLDRGAINEVAIGEGGVPAMMEGRVSAAVGFTFNLGAEVQAAGGNVGFLPFGEHGLEVPGASIVAPTSVVESDPALVRDFVEATMRGWEYTLQNPDEALKIFFQNAEDVDRELNELKLPLVSDAVRSENGAGYVDMESWDRLVRLYLDEELVEGPLEVDQVVTDDFVE